MLPEGFPFHQFNIITQQKTNVLLFSLHLKYMGNTNTVNRPDATRCLHVVKSQYIRAHLYLHKTSIKYVILSCKWSFAIYNAISNNIFIIDNTRRWVIDLINSVRSYVAGLLYFANLCGINLFFQCCNIILVTIALIICIKRQSEKMGKVFRKHRLDGENRYLLFIKAVH